MQKKNRTSSVYGLPCVSADMDKVVFDNGENNSNIIMPFTEREIELLNIAFLKYRSLLNDQDHSNAFMIEINDLMIKLYHLRREYKNDNRTK